MNGTNGHFFGLHLFFGGADKSEVFTHPDPTVDLALVPLTFDLRSVGISPLLSSLIATRESYKSLSIQEGDEMFFLGLFTPFYGSKQNIPIYRFGRLSMLSEEKIPFSHDDEDLILMECQVFGGNSGSPAFFYFNEQRNPGGTKILLAGVVKGFFRDWSEVKFVDAKQMPISPNNVGISAVTPGYYILDILQSEKFQPFLARADQIARLTMTTNSPSVTKTN